MINRVVLVGRLTRDPELRYTTSGVPVVTFTLAVERRFKNAQGERETDFIPIVAYRHQAEFISNYASKGRLAGVEGRMQVRKYQTPDGQQRTVTEVVADNVTLLDRRPEAAATEPVQPVATSAQPGAAPSGIDQELAVPDDEFSTGTMEDDLPF